ncbi:peroxiredoxin [Clostridium sp. N3C]|uniref:peroxiredoxin n=1 Tax=Clostridium sp. N3C TaxID=1776758 RepID=UPI00241C1E57|nr:peroxiredoxin [Clostridium sp. N3C]
MHGYRRKYSKDLFPQIGAMAPDFEAITTFGNIKLSNFREKWVVLFSHPGDFTPVCTTEFIAFARYFPYFVERNAQLIGLSVDSNASHLAWVYNIYCNTGIEIPFPVIDDRSLKVSNLYGMISPATSETATVRSVYIIDPQGILRTILYYPLTIGRNIPEILRILDALQMSDAEKVATPADWMPGMPVIIPAPTTYEGLKQRISNQDGYSCMDWYLCYKEINNKIEDGGQS